MVDHERDEDFRPVPDEDGDWWNENDDGWSREDDALALAFEEAEMAEQPDFEKGGWCQLHNRPHHMAGIACEQYSAELFAGTT